MVLLKKKKQFYLVHGNDLSSAQLSSWHPQTPHPPENSIQR